MSAIPMTNDPGATTSTPAANDNDKVKSARTIFNDLSSGELIFAVVGPAGSGTSYIANQIETLVKDQLKATNVSQIKVSKILQNHLSEDEQAGFQQKNKLQRAITFQDAGDRLRKSDESAIAVKILAQIQNERIDFKTKTAINDISPQRQATEEEPPTVYIIDSLKNPAEAELLRGVYREAFYLIGVVCEESVRKTRLRELKCKDSSSTDVDLFMKRDEDAEEKYGQKVADTFHLSDFFVNNTNDRTLDGSVPNPNWDVSEKLGRLIDILSGKKIVRPEHYERAMFHAKGAQLRSACLSRQVGAALTDKEGNIIATGTNEVPMAGGGVYGGNFDDNKEQVSDHRCHIHNKYCSNSRTQREIIDEIIAALPEFKFEVPRQELEKKIKSTSVGRLIEFSRAVHAEMDALLSAAREGESTVGTKLFVTTFPCHYCARHIVTAGVEEVQYIEPYPKSRAISLHKDAIQQNSTLWMPHTTGKRDVNTKVLFRAFTGVAPRLYRRAFAYDRKLKDDFGDMQIQKPKWKTGLLRESYTSIEKALINGEINHGQ